MAHTPLLLQLFFCIDYHHIYASTSHFVVPVTWRFHLCVLCWCCKSNQRSIGSRCIVSGCIDACQCASTKLNTSFVLIAPCMRCRHCMFPHSSDHLQACLRWLALYAASCGETTNAGDSELSSGVLRPFARVYKCHIVSNEMIESINPITCTSIRYVNQTTMQATPHETHLVRSSCHNYWVWKHCIYNAHK